MFQRGDALGGLRGADLLLVAGAVGLGFERVIIRPPSAELRPDQKDQDSLPAYDVLDAILYAYIEEDASQDDIIAKGFDAEVVAKIIRLVDINEYKRRQGAIGPRISSRAFSRERRYPIVNGWKPGI